MSIVGTTLIFCMLWWIIFFMTLPIGSQEHPRIGKKMLITTGVTVFLTLLLYYLAGHGYLHFMNFRGAIT